MIDVLRGGMAVANYDIKYKTGDEIYIAGKIERAEVINSKVYYKIAEADELIPQHLLLSRKELEIQNIIRETVNNEIRRFTDELKMLINAPGSISRNQKEQNEILLTIRCDQGAAYPVTTPISLA